MIRARRESHKTISQIITPIPQDCARQQMIERFTFYKNASHIPKRIHPMEQKTCFGEGNILKLVNGYCCEYSSRFGFVVDIPATSADPQYKHKCV